MRNVGTDIVVGPENYRFYGIILLEAKPGVVERMVVVSEVEVVTGTGDVGGDVVVVEGIDVVIGTASHSAKFTLALCFLHFSGAEVPL